MGTDQHVDCNDRIPDNWERYDHETYLKQPHWQHKPTAETVYISYNPNIGGYADPREWAAVRSESRRIDGDAERLGAFKNREQALNKAEEWMQQHPEGAA